MKDCYGNYPLGGRIKHFVDFWKTFTHDRFVIRNLYGLELEFTEKVVQFKEPHSIKMSDNEMKIMDEKVKELLENKTLRIVNHKKGEGFISNVFLREKRDSTHRMILNLKNLNSRIKAPHFKMNTISANPLQPKKKDGKSRS